MAILEVEIPSRIRDALFLEAGRTGATLASVVTSALSQFLAVPTHTLFQISTSGALVAGVFDKEITVESILEHGDFGLGTFANLDGEMVILDGHVYQVEGTGRVAEASPDAGAPFAVVTRFAPQIDLVIDPVSSFKELQDRCDELRRSGNIFYALRLDGNFKKLRTRAVNPPSAGSRLIDAAKAQSLFDFSDIDGTLVGIWSPGFSSAFSVAGYHFHFISSDRRHGGHVLEVEAERLALQVEALTDFHLALPASEAFLKVDLTRNTADELAYAEQAHKE
jgi:acetolactate decarboxylase